MNTFIEKTMDWLLDKEEATAQNGKIDLENIDKQINQVQNKKEKYQQEVERTLHELNHIIDRLQAIRDNQSSSLSGNRDRIEGKRF